MNHIIWEKWRDPFLGYDDNEIDLENNVFDNFYDEEDEDIDEELKDNIVSPSKHIGKQVRVIATPMGLIPYNEYTASSKIFNFWIGHTNFDLTRQVAQIIEHTNGVETLDIFTRYRFRIGIGKAFEDREVMKNIEDQIK